MLSGPRIRPGRLRGLFLVGTGSSFQLAGVRYALIALGSVLLILSVVLILQQPALPS